jgi:hypothetical protein
MPPPVTPSAAAGIGDQTADHPRPELLAKPVPRPAPSDRVVPFTLPEVRRWPAVATEFAPAAALPAEYAGTHVLEIENRAGEGQPCLSPALPAGCRPAPGRDEHPFRTPRHPIPVRHARRERRSPRQPVSQCRIVRVGRRAACGAAQAALVDPRAAGRFDPGSFPAHPARRVLRRAAPPAREFNAQGAADGAGECAGRGKRQDLTTVLHLLRRAPLGPVHGAQVQVKRAGRDTLTAHAVAPGALADPPSPGAQPTARALGVLGVAAKRRQSRLHAVARRR